jgi:flagellar assembly protein FliH
MTSFPSLAPVISADAALEKPEALQQKALQPEALPFAYREVAGGGGRRDALPTVSPSAARVPDAQSAAAREAQAREAGRQQGEREGCAKLEEQLGRERAGILKAVQDFSAERAAYYQKIESEAVQLALSIARKILHREAQVDPPLLMGIVRVALDRIEGATGVALSVPGQAAEWRAYFAAHMTGGSAPEVVEDSKLANGQCVLKTSMGTAELGLEPQMKEIEQGLMDLLAARPRP